MGGRSGGQVGSFLALKICREVDIAFLAAWSSRLDRSDLHTSVKLSSLRSVFVLFCQWPRVPISIVIKLDV